MPCPHDSGNLPFENILLYSLRRKGEMTSKLLLNISLITWSGPDAVLLFCKNTADFNTGKVTSVSRSSSWMVSWESD